MTKEPYIKPDTKAEVSHKDMSLKEAAEMALEALQYTCDYLPVKTATERQVDEAITALQVALLTEGNTKSNLVKTYCGNKPNYCTPADAVNMSQECVDETAKGGHKWVWLTVTAHDRYLERQRIAEEQHIQRVALAEREWVGLSDEDLSVCDEDGVLLVRYWEAKLKEKNT